MATEREPLAAAPQTAEAPPPMTTDTKRLEAFSDGVFAVAITLLALNLRVPAASDLRDAHGHLRDIFAFLGSQWPSYLAFVTSFLFILVMWMNHHMLFRLIGKADNLLMILNGLLLLFVVVVPFITILLADYLQYNSRLPVGENRRNQLEVAVVYNGVYIVISIFFNALWRYASHENRLLEETAHPDHVRGVTDGYRWGALYYVAALLLALVSIPASLVLNIALAIYFALPRTRQRKRTPAATRTEPARTGRA
ncbi:MAG TPA: TMEM175 family protein [Ktedonobacterales bacterium]|nr:TMEM175 family protein [Ktedonobacterales bacterium]